MLSPTGTAGAALASVCMCVYVFVYIVCVYCVAMCRSMSIRWDGCTTAMRSLVQCVMWPLVYLRGNITVGTVSLI